MTNALGRLANLMEQAFSKEPPSAVSSSSRSSSREFNESHIGLSSKEQAILCADLKLLKLFQERQSAGDFFSTSKQSKTERQLFCKWISTIINTNMGALIEPTYKISKHKRLEIINLASNIICSIMKVDYDLTDISNPMITEQISK
jgi:hypothetical protein